MGSFRNQHMLCGIVLVTVQLFKIAESLQCYTCESLEVEGSDSSLFSKKFAEKSDPNCESAGYATTKTKTCPDSFNSRCGLIKAESTVSVLFVGKYTVRSLARGCMEATSDGCVDEASKLIEGVGKLLTFAGEFDDVKTSGKLCYCSYDNCVAGGCLDGEVPIIGQCFAWYYVLLGVAGLVGLGFLLTCCCCCCCTCCRSKSRHVPVVQSFTVPGHVVVTNVTSDGIHSIQNPGYENVSSVEMRP